MKSGDSLSHSKGLSVICIPFIMIIWIRKPTTNGEFIGLTKVTHLLSVFEREHEGSSKLAGPGSSKLPGPGSLWAVLTTEL